MNDAHCRHITFNVVLRKFEKLEKLPLVGGTASTCSEACVTEFTFKGTSAYEGTKNKNQIKMGTAGLERCYTNEGTWKGTEEEELDCKLTSIKRKWIRKEKMCVECLLWNLQKGHGLCILLIS
jgi:hypothetical protein